jgi:hypothetical protein
MYADSIASEKTLPDLPYHVFGKSKKRIIVYFVSFLAMLSPLSSNIYFPALDAIASVSLNSPSGGRTSDGNVLILQ